MAARTRRASAPSRSRSTRRTSLSRSLARSLHVQPHVARSLIAVTLLVIGAITLIALMFPTGGILTGYVDGLLRPGFGQGALLLALLLLLAGFVIERPSALGYASAAEHRRRRCSSSSAGLGMIHLAWGHGAGQRALREGGGWVGQALSAGLSDLVSPAGAFVILLGLIAAGLMLHAQRHAAHAAQPGHRRWPRHRQRPGDARAGDSRRRQRAPLS